MLIFDLIERALGFLRPSLFPWGGGDSGVDIGDNIAYSLMLDSSASQYLNRIPSINGDGRTLFRRYMVKRGLLSGSYGVGGSTVDVNNMTAIVFRTDDTIQIFHQVAGSTVLNKITSQVFRDPSGFYDILVIFDTNNATAEDRVRLYVSGVRVTSFSTNTIFAVATSTFFHSTAANELLGRGTTSYGDGYLAMCIGGDGITSSGPSSFGKFSADTGQWVPKNYTGTYGTNGFKLDFTNGAALGTDTSGNGNNWTLNGGITSANQYTDTPTNNYCVLSYINSDVDQGFASGALKGYPYNQRRVAGTIAMSTGKWYWEVTPLAAVGTLIGISSATRYQKGSVNALGYFADDYAYVSTANKRTNNADTAYGTAYTTNDVIGVALDADAGTLTFYKNGVSQGVAFSALSGSWYPVASGGASQNSICLFNFGQRPFAYTPPSGFKALCTANLPATGTVTVSGAFTGNLNADGPFVFCNGYPTTLTINGNAVTFATHADRTANGFKLRTASASYNNTGSNTWTATIVSNQKNLFKYANAQGNP